MKSLNILVGNLTQNVTVVLLLMWKPGQIAVVVVLGSKHFTVFVPFFKSLWEGRFPAWFSVWSYHLQLCILKKDYNCISGFNQVTF